jgi:hypothetical protein
MYLSNVHSTNFKIRISKYQLHYSSLDVKLQNAPNTFPMEVIMNRCPWTQIDKFETQHALSVIKKCTQCILCTGCTLDDDLELTVYKLYINHAATAERRFLIREKSLWLLALIVILARMSRTAVDFVAGKVAVLTAGWTICRLPCAFRGFI